MPWAISAEDHKPVSRFMYSYYNDGKIYACALSFVEKFCRCFRVMVLPTPVWNMIISPKQRADQRYSSDEKLSGLPLHLVPRLTHSSSEVSIMRNHFTQPKQIHHALKNEREIFMAMRISRQRQIYHPRIYRRRYIFNSKLLGNALN